MDHVFSREQFGCIFEGANSGLEFLDDVSNGSGVFESVFDMYTEKFCALVLLESSCANVE